MTGRNDMMLRYLAAIAAVQAEGGTVASRAGLDLLESVVAARTAILEGLAREDDEGALRVTTAGGRWARGQMTALVPLMRTSGLMATPAPLASPDTPTSLAKETTHAE
mgnify:CR=1 FL=1